jgi:acetate kinase
VVHGGKLFTRYDVITEDVKDRLQNLPSRFTITHNLEGIILAEELFSCCPANSSI